MTIGSGIVTPTGYAATLLDQIVTTSPTSAEDQIALSLSNLADGMGQWGDVDLAARLDKISRALVEGDYTRSQWATSELLEELEKIQQALLDGKDIREVIDGRIDAQALEEITSGRQARRFAPTPPVSPAVGPPPPIKWFQYGSPEHPAPLEPSPEVNTSARRLNYVVHYVAGMAVAVETGGETEEFYGISAAARRRLERGIFIPKLLGKNFPTEDAHSIVEKAHSVEPRYGELVQELMIQSAFEMVGWPLGVPVAETSWDVSFLYALRRFLVSQMFTSKENVETLFADRALVRVVQGKASLADVRWHPGRTRHDVYENWLHQISRGNEASMAVQRQFIGNGLLRSIGWPPPRNGVTKEQRLQWMVRKWIVYYHYGALPARGLPLPTDVIIRFAMARQPERVTPAFAVKLLDMTKDFYPATELSPVRSLFSK